MKLNEILIDIPELFDAAQNWVGANLQLFASGTNVQKTDTGTLSVEMKTFYSDYLIDRALPYLVHDQFGQKKPIPSNGGKTVEFRKWESLGKATTALTEGVTPTGQTLTVSNLTATVSQYGGYVEVSDMLDLTAIDNVILEATDLIGEQAGQTLDTIVRDIIVAGTNVQYCDSEVAARYLLVGGQTSGNHYMTVDCIRRAVRTMKYNKAKKYDSYYVAIIHPDVAYDIMGDDDWVSASEYSGAEQIFQGEIGKLHGVRFVETTEAKILHGENLTAASRNLTVASFNGVKTITVNEAISASEATALVGRYILVADPTSPLTDVYKYTVASCASGGAGAATITVSESVSHAPAGSDIVYPGEAAGQGRDAYATLVIGKNAYGVTEITGGGLETIVKQLGSAGTGDPLNQRATVGWKATKTAVRLTEVYMLRIETASTFNNNAAN